MSKRIAVVIDQNQMVGKLLESETIIVFSKEYGVWRVDEEILVDLELSKGAGVLRKGLVELAESLEDCRILITKEISGLPFTVLDSMGFHLWELEGSPEALVDYVSNQEERIEAQTSAAKTEIAPMPLEQSGYYFIDLIQLQQGDAMISTKQALLPFLRSTSFYQLEIVCSHIPPWFEGEFDKLGLNGNVEKVHQNKYKVIVHKKTCV